jgi:hypothetical protein
LGWHQCEYEPDDETQWHAGTLHESKLDVSSSLWALARRFVPLDVLKRKLDEYIAEGHLAAEEKDAHVETFEQMRGVLRETNVSGWAKLLQLSFFYPGSHSPPLQRPSTALHIQSLKSRAGVVTMLNRLFEKSTNVSNLV